MKKKITALTPTLIIIGAIMSTATSAEIYRHVDKSGQVTYSNTRIIGAKKVHLNRTLAKER